MDLGLKLLNTTRVLRTCYTHLMANQKSRALAYFPSDGGVRQMEVPVPSPDPDEVLIRIKRVAITRRDLLMLSSTDVVLPEDDDYIIPGHIATGVVLETGPMVKEFRAGDLVAPTIRRDCDRCIDARSDLCSHPERYQDSGLSGAHGFARDLIAIPGRYLVKIPPHLENIALLLAPLSVAEKAHSEAVQITKRYNFYCYHESDDVVPRALITGLDPVGIMTTYLLSLYNYRLTVFCRRESDDFRSRIIEPLDLEYINTSRVPMEKLKNDGYSFQQLFETTGDPEYLLSVMPLMSPNAIMAIMGAPETHNVAKKLEVDLNWVLSKLVIGNQVVFGSIKAGRDAFDSAVKHLTELSDLYSDSLAILLKDTFPFSEYQQLLDMSTRSYVIPSLLLT